MRKNAVLAAAFAVALQGCAGTPTIGTGLLRLATAPFHKSYPYAAPKKDASLDEIASRAQLSFIRPSANHAKVAVLDVYGTPYEMGYQQGRLLKNEVRETMQENFVGLARKVLWDAQLDNIYKRLEPHIPPAYKEEIQGLADGSGVDVKIFQWSIAIPEFTEQMCSGYTALPGATKDGHSYHIRILDYGTWFNVQQHPAVIIYHPKDGYASANFTWAGFIGSVGGVNETGLSVGELGGGPGTKADPETFNGIPCSILLREVLAKTNSVASAERMIDAAQRTNRYVYFLADGVESSMVLSSPKLFDAAAPGSFPASIPYCHGRRRLIFPGVQDTLFLGVKQEKLYNELKEDAPQQQVSLQKIMQWNKEQAMRSNLHVWIFRNDTLEAWFANAKGDKRAADQPYVYLDLKQHFRGGFRGGT